MAPVVRPVYLLARILAIIATVLGALGRVLTGKGGLFKKPEDAFFSHDDDDDPSNDNDPPVSPPSVEQLTELFYGLLVTIIIYLVLLGILWLLDFFLVLIILRQENTLRNLQQRVSLSRTSREAARVRYDRKQLKDREKYKSELDTLVNRIKEKPADTTLADAMEPLPEYFPEKDGTMRAIASVMP